MVEAYLEDASQTYKKGTPLVVTTAGYLGTAVVANPYNGGGLVGVSVNPGSNVAAGAADPNTGDKYHLMYPISASTIKFIGQLAASSTGPIASMCLALHAWDLHRPAPRPSDASW